jgi:hypothetical protein
MPVSCICSFHFVVFCENILFFLPHRNWLGIFFLFSLICSKPLSIWSFSFFFDLRCLAWLGLCVKKLKDVFFFFLWLFLINIYIWHHKSFHWLWMPTLFTLRFWVSQLRELILGRCSKKCHAFIDCSLDVSVRVWVGRLWRDARLPQTWRWGYSFWNCLLRRVFLFYLFIFYPVTWLCNSASCFSPTPHSAGAAVMSDAVYICSSDADAITKVGVSKIERITHDGVVKNRNSLSVPT